MGKPCNCCAADFVPTVERTILCKTCYTDPFATFFWMAADPPSPTRRRWLKLPTTRLLRARLAREWGRRNPEKVKTKWQDWKRSPGHAAYYKKVAAKKREQRRDPEWRAAHGLLPFGKRRPDGDPAPVYLSKDEQDTSPK